MKNIARLIIVVGALTLALPTGIPLARGQGSGGASTFQSYAKPMPLPDFALEELSGKIVPIKDSRGSVLLLHFWATW